VDLWPITIAARQSLLSTMKELDDDQWTTRSLCDGWTIRDVLAHLILAARPPLRRYVGAVMRARGNFDRANDALTATDAQQPIDKLLADFARVVDHRFNPPGWPAAAPLSDVMLHSLDVRVPLGLDSVHPAEQYEPVIAHLFSRAGRSFARPGRPSLRWIATDHEWSVGDGASVSGDMADLALAASGRGARLGHLTGSGVDELVRWLGLSALDGDS